MGFPASRPVRVLVVEDDRTTGRALEQLLKHYRYEVTTATTVAGALGHLNAGLVPDAVLLDLMLPDGDGMRVLEEIREREMHARVTVVTGVGDPHCLERARQLNPDALLQKPLEFHKLLAQLPPVG